MVLLCFFSMQAFYSLFLLPTASVSLYAPHLSFRCDLDQSCCLNKALNVTSTGVGINFHIILPLICRCITLDESFKPGPLT